MDYRVICTKEEENGTDNLYDATCTLISRQMHAFLCLHIPDYFLKSIRSAIKYPKDHEKQWELESSNDQKDVPSSLLTKFNSGPQGLTYL